MAQRRAEGVHVGRCSALPEATVHRIVASEHLGVV